MTTARRIPARNAERLEFAFASWKRNIVSDMRRCSETELHSALNVLFELTPSVGNCEGPRELSRYLNAASFTGSWLNS
jgi:hypothetical protein